MKPILFWLLGSLSLLASVWAVSAKRPARSVQALVIVLVAMACNLFVLSNTLLAFEMLLLTVAAASLVWIVVIRGKRMRLGPPGRSRLNLTRFVAFFIAVGLGTLIWWAMAHSGATGQPSSYQTLTRGFGFSLAAALLGSASVTAWVVGMAGKRCAQNEPNSASGVSDSGDSPGERS